MRTIVRLIPMACLLLLSTVSAQSTSVSVSPTSVAPGGNVTVTINNPPGGSGDWVAVYDVAETDYTEYLSAQVIDEENPDVRVFAMPLVAGSYNVRVLAGSATIATSATVTVSGGTSVSVSDTEVAPGATVTVTITNPPGGSGDWVALYDESETNYTAYLSAQVIDEENPDIRVFEMPMTEGAFNIRVLAGSATVAVSDTILVAGGESCSSVGYFDLPINSSWPVIFDNDGVVESGLGTDLHLLARKALGTWNVQALITSGEGGSWTDQQVLQEREDWISYADQSGFDLDGLDHLLGSRTSITAVYTTHVGYDYYSDTTTSVAAAMATVQNSNLHTPSAGALAIVAAAHAACAEEMPLIVMTGGPPTTIVEAYLLDPTIATKMVVLSQIGHKELGNDNMAEDDDTVIQRTFNFGHDPLATYILFDRLQAIAFPYVNGDNTPVGDGKPSHPESRMQTDLRASVLKTEMIAAEYPAYGPDWPDYAADSGPDIAAITLDYVLEWRTMAFDGWENPEDSSGHQKPRYRTGSGTIPVAWVVSDSVATDVWWDAMLQPGTLEP